MPGTAPAKEDLGTDMIEEAGQDLQEGTENEIGLPGEDMMTPGLTLEVEGTEEEITAMMKEETEEALKDPDEMTPDREIDLTLQETEGINLTPQGTNATNLTPQGTRTIDRNRLKTERIQARRIDRQRTTLLGDPTKETILKGVKMTVLLMIKRRKIASLRKT